MVCIILLASNIPEIPSKVRLACSGQLWDYRYEAHLPMMRPFPTMVSDDQEVPFPALIVKQFMSRRNS
jgi:hypothetical protein